MKTYIIRRITIPNAGMSAILGREKYSSNPLLISVWAYV
jgi:hypothetical protein